MTMRFAGVALAAVVGVCALVGGVERAEALQISVSGSGVDPQDGLYGISIDIAGRYATLSYTYYNSVSGLFGPYTVINNSISGDGTSAISLFTNNYIEFNVSIPKATETDTIYGSDDPSNDFTRSYTTQAYARFGLDINPADGIQLVNLSFDGGNLFLYSTLVSADISSVPLPRSVDLLGIVLIALGGASYARRRYRFSALAR